MTAPGVVLHDYFEAAEGGGRLCLTLARGLGFDLGYGFKAPGHPFFEPPFAGREHDLGVRVRLPLVRQIALARRFASSAAAFAAGYDRAVYSGSYAPLAVRRRPGRGNVLYCHTPPRFLFDRRGHFARLAPAPLRPLLGAFVRRLAPRYLAAARAMDLVVANSKTVRERIRTHLGLDAEVVHPPCDLSRFRYLSQEGYYLSMARLDSLKRVDRVVQAFARMPGKKLKVVSTGPEEPRIRTLARNLANVEVLGAVDEARLAELVGRCVATIYVPWDEDFGMSPVESMAAGKPVIGVAEGGVAETVLHEETGLLLPADPDPQAIAAGVQAMTEADALVMRSACRRRAELFSEQVFLERMGALLDAL